jgi:hypothetical protein
MSACQLGASNSTSLRPPSVGFLAITQAAGQPELVRVVNVGLGQPLAVWLFFENTDSTPSHLRHFIVVLNLINRPAASLSRIFPVPSLEQVGPELSDGFRAIDRLHARRH